MNYSANAFLFIDNSSPHDHCVVELVLDGGGGGGDVDVREPVHDHSLHHQVDRRGTEEMQER